MSADIKYYRVITREGPLVSFQFESWADEQGYRDIHIPPETLPAEIIVNRDGLVTCYYRSDSEDHYDRCYSDKAYAEPIFFKEVFAEYETLLNALDGMLGLPRPWTRSQLLEVLALEKNASAGIFHSYCVPNIKGISEEIRNQAMDFRKREDRIGYRVREEIKKTLQALYPTHPLAYLCSWEEITSDNVPSDDVLQARAHEYVIEDGKILNETLETFLRRTNRSLAEDKPEVGATEVKGQIAFAGIVRGRAHIILRASEIGSFQDGEILVTHMTTPNFLPALKKAAAFVTEEGGITCHAAIVAREMKKPCVIGTQQACKVFKTGDMIEVDAHKGIVRTI